MTQEESEGLRLQCECKGIDSIRTGNKYNNCYEFYWAEYWYQGRSIQRKDDHMTIQFMADEKNEHYVYIVVTEYDKHIDMDVTKKSFYNQQEAYKYITQEFKNLGGKI